MTLHLSEPRITERDPSCVVGVYAVFEGEDEPWGEVFHEFERRRAGIRNREGDTLLGFLYRPHKDNPSIPEDVRSCFMGVEVTDLTQVPEGMTATRFTGGKYAIVECKGDTENEAAMGVGDAVDNIEKWLPENGYREGDACFACSHEEADKPPFIQYVYVKLEEQT
jgi:predicted transcriptional regulator YdeE